VADENNSNSSNKVFFAIIIALVVVIAGLFYYFQTRIAAIQSGVKKAENAQTMNKSPKEKEGGKMAPGMSMSAVTPPVVSDQQKEQIALGESASTKVKTFNITGANFFFVPNKITVNKGDKVTLVMTNAGGFHNIALDEFGVKSPMAKSGEAVSVTFTASKSGSFIYYCDVPGHRAKGMWGTLTVK
jgi:plastocyanin